MQIGVIADDFTGATDIAGFLVANGLATTQMIGVPDADARVAGEAVVISLKSRSNPADEAVADSLAALTWLRARGCKQIFQKYCSTFDSTAHGNIGPVADALLDALDSDLTVVCPSLPVNGRTVYNGYLFVNGVLLEDSGMRDHPITPMRDSSLVRLMEGQSRGACGVVPVETVEQGVDAVRAAIAAARGAGKRYVVLDAITDAHIDVLGQAVRDMALVTGGSGLAAGIARALCAPAQAGTSDAAAAGQPLAGRGVVLAGSCSQMTRQQVAAYRKIAPALAVDPARCVAEAEAYGAELAEWVLAQPAGADMPAPLVYATADPDAVRKVHDRFGAAASEAVETSFATIAARLADAGITRFVVAGGETSGSVVKALGLSGFAIGPQIAPGVPWVRAINKPYSLALKSGNFGAEDFFLDCQPLEVRAAFKEPQEAHS
ncbi:3-oxo-tetronate kinase [Tropicimonas sp. IMCC34043]|uniref:3-oxo-tetronate kinase n=1 Tax=Tropicimonas sp. IMCC34043 TaxID=2248760 RepID=UPI000E2746AD|nr:3-oxo-tetronate kinase [Tropicimonas sp. IMCC34043]